MARYDLRRTFAKQQPSQEEFAAAYGESIRSHLSRQRQTPFLLAQVKRDIDIELAKDEWYWILRVKGSPPMVSYVSDDYFVYKHPLEDFRLSNDQVEKLRGGGAA